MTETFQLYSVEYSMDGSRWTIDVMATSQADAKRRLEQAAAFGNVVGPIQFRVKIAPDWFGRWWQRRRQQ